jgi:hypothetical protein
MNTCPFAPLKPMPLPLPLEELTRTMLRPLVHATSAAA